MFDNVDDRFLPVAEHRPILSFGHPVLHYVHSRQSLNAGSELTDATLRRVGPDQVAYIHVGAGGVERWTYGRLQAQVNRVAHGLHAQGVRAGDRVLTRFSEVPQAVIVQLATWKLGAIVVPSAPVETARELAYMLNDTEAVAVVAESDSATEVEKALADAPSVRTVIGWPGPIGGDGLTLDSVAHAQPETFEAYPTRPLDASGIYYTGGTTGRPKGCVHTHAGELAVADLSNAARGVTAASVLLTHAPIGHAFGNGERLNFPLRAGACAVMATRPTPTMMWELMNEFGVDTVAGAATMYRMMLAAVPHPKTVYPGLKLTTAMSSGEILDPHTAEVWQEEVGIPLRNAVGMTPMRHAFLDSMWRGDKVAPGLSVGCPLPSYEARILAADGSNVDNDGVAGRLAVRGPTGITYWINNNEALTLRAAQDVIDGWSILDDAYVRDAEGWLWFNGRLDDMIVTGGRQVAPVEVEEILAGHPAVAEVAVVPAPDEVRGQVVAAFITPTAGTVLTPELVTELQEHVKKHLAGYKYPRRIEFVDELPKDAVGKLSRRRLRESLAADGPRGGGEP